MKIFITDGSPEAFFTAVFDAFAEKECIVTSDENVQLAFDSQVILYTTKRNANACVRA